MLAAAGIGTRMGGPRKQFLMLLGRPVFVRSLELFSLIESMAEAVVAVPPGCEAEAREAIVAAGLSGFPKGVKVLAGGATRQESVGRAVEAVDPSIELIAVHDAARPLATPEVIRRVIAAAEGVDGAIAALPMSDTVKSEAGETQVIASTVDRSRLWRSQTPQVFWARTLREALAAAKQSGFEGTDDASLVERIGGRILLVEGSEENIKITRPEDLPLAEAIFRRRGAV